MSAPANGGQGTADSSDTTLITDDGPGDTTPRPRPPNIPRYFPGREEPPGLEKPPERKPPTNPEKENPDG
jgi:hypothetical protein